MPNPTGYLLPGMYVRVRLEQAQTENGIVVPQQAVTRGTTGDSVMVVAADGKVAPRPVRIGSAIGGGWLVLDGLSAGEMVMVDGFQKLRGNAPVKPVPWQPAASGAPPQNGVAANVGAGSAPASGAQNAVAGPSGAQGGTAASSGVPTAAVAASAAAPAASGR